MLTREKLLELATVIREETAQGLNTAQRVGHLLYELASSFLIKTQDDETAHKLSIDELEAVEQLIVAGTQLVGQKNVALENVVSQIHGSQLVEGGTETRGSSRHTGDTFFGPQFVSGLLGKGGYIGRDGAAELKSLTLREFLEAPEYRLNKVTSIAGRLVQSWSNGIIESVVPLTESTGYFLLKLEDGEAGSCAPGDICMGIFHYGDGRDSVTDSDDLRGNVTSAGFTTTYFRVESCRGVRNKIVYYTLRPHRDPETGDVTGHYDHPRAFMKFSSYGSFTNTERQTAIIISHSYIRMVREVNDWEFSFRNIALQIGELDGLREAYKDEGCPSMTGYSAYLRNIYFTGKIEQLDEDAIEDISARMRAYDIEFSSYVDVITVDDVGNVIGGLWTVSGQNQEYRRYRIQSAISVRRSGQPLTIDLVHAQAQEGTFKVHLDPHGCSCIIEDSTISITHIDNIKDGVAGTPDDVNFDYEAMRNMDSCCVDVIVDCEGHGSIQKRLPIRIKHDSQPFVGADITNPFSAVSWNTRTSAYIGLPIVFDMKMWHNSEPLDVVNTSDISLVAQTAGVTLVNGTAPATPASGTIYYSKSIVTIIRNPSQPNEFRYKAARITITAMAPDIPLVTELACTCASTYSGVRYERTLSHTINKSTDVNVYSLLPSVNEVIVGNSGLLSTQSLTCKIICDSTDNEHYQVLVDSNGKNTAHKLYLCWKKQYHDGTSDAAYTKYSGAVAIDSSVVCVIFTLYGLDASGNPDTNVFHDQEDVPVLTAGVDGKSVEFIFFRQNAETPKPTLYDASQDSTKDSGQTKTRAELFQEDNYCPFTSAANYGSQSEQWTDEPQGIGQNERFEFYAERKKVNGVWQPFSAVHLWNRYATDGQSSYIIDLTNENSFVNCETDGTPLAGALYETSEVLILFGITDKRSDFNIKVVPTNISCNGYYPRGGTAVSGQTECPQGGFTLPINGSYVLTPSDIKEGAATIAVTATHKTNSNIVLVATYKINKNMAGQTGVIYSLIPSLNVIQKNLDGTFRDTTLNVQVKKTKGTTTELLSTYKTIADEGLTLSYENNDANSPFLLVTSGATSTSNVSVASSSFVNDSGNGTYGKLILKKNNVVSDTERINVVKDGKDGVSQPFYIDSEEAWSDSSTSHPAESSSAWSKITPTKNGKYLWRRTRKMVLNSAGTGYTPASAQDGGSWSYQLLSGTDGTSVNVKGKVATVAALGNISNPQDGDAYKCEADGHLYMWSTEANNWIDLGQFKGEDGDNVHIAWADNVTISNGNVTSVTGFTIGVGSNGDGKSWMGVCIDKNAADPTTYASYTWRYVKGEQGVDAGDREWIYKRQSSPTAPSIPSSSGTGTVNGVSTAYGNTIDDWVPSGWTDNPQGVTINEPYEFACYRDKARGATTWGPFVGVQGSPLLWSHYGERGTDGDGVEYVFIRTKKNVAPTLDSTQNGYDTDDFCPQASVSNDYVKGQESGNTLTTATCTDDPVGTSETWPYEWVAKRTKTAAVNGVRSWTKYTEMSLWANWSKDGVSVQSYIKTWEAWSDSESDPTIDVSTWSESTPAKTKKYLWRRSLLMTLNAAGTDYEGALNSQNQPDYKYQMLSGTDGTSIKPKGNVIYVASSSGSLPSSNVAANSLAIVVSSQKLYKYNSGWSQVSANSADGDCYVVTGECTYGGENVKGFMFMWSDESGAWIPLGQFKGEEGVTYYTHIAWTDDVDTSHPWTGDLPAGQTSTPSVSSASYVGGTNGHFSVSPQEGYDWMGICINTSKTDPPSSQRHYYTWKYTKGERGVDASDREWIYLQSDSATAPNIPASSGTGTVNGVATAYANTVDDWVPAGWTDSPLGVTDSMPYEYACYRDKERGGTTWSVFKGTNGKALLWSHYGQRGTDGDGVEYVFVRTKENVAPEVPSSGTYSEGSQGYDSDDHLPYVRIAKTKDIKGYNGGEGTTSGDYKYVKCTDDPVGTDSTWKFEWVLKRTKGSASNGVRSWNAYTGAMSLWANWSKDGVSMQSYNETQEAWSDNKETANAFTSPATRTNVVDGADGSAGHPIDADWSVSTPANPNNLLYLWRRSRKMVLNSSGTAYEAEQSGGVLTDNGKWKYQRLSGTNGTNIDVKGNVATTSQLGDGYVYPFVNGATSQTQVSVSDGQTYICNADGHLYQWSDELRSKSGSWTDYSSGWLDLGQFKGDKGTDYYTHIAWTDKVTLGTYTGPVPADQTTTPNVAGATEAAAKANVGTHTINNQQVVHFSESPQEGYDWMGVLINTSSGALDANSRHLYTWKYVKGADGTSPWLAYIDNEMDSIRTTDAGVPTSNQSVETAPSLYHGATPQTLIISSVKRNGTAMTVVTADTRWSATGITVVYDSSEGVITISYTTSAAISGGKDEFTITIGDSQGTVSFDRIMTVLATSGDIYNLKPSVSQIKVGRDGSGNYSPSAATISCGYVKKNIEGGITLVDDASSQIDGTYNIYFRLRTRSNQTWATGYERYGEGGNHTMITSTGFNVAQKDAVQFILCKNTGDTIASDAYIQGLIDRQTVSVVADGEDGNGIASVTTTYGRSSYGESANDSTAPSGLDTSVGTNGWAAGSPEATANYPFLWRREYTLFTNGTSTTKYYCIGKLGNRGIDGPGSEWVYIRTKTDTPPVLRDDDDYPDSNGKDYDDDDYLPKVAGNANIENDNSGDTTNHPYECSDDPKGVSELWPFEWEAKRMKLLNQAGSAREWQKYYDAMPSHQMVLSNRWSEDAVMYWIETNSLVFHRDIATDTYSPSVLRVVVHRVEGDTDTVLTWANLTTYGLTLQFNDNNGMDWSDINSSQYAELSGNGTDADSWLADITTEEWRVTKNGDVLATAGVSVIENGEAGDTGPMFYLAGVYDDLTEYTRTKDLCPVVFYDGSYYYLKRNSQGNLPTNSSYWGGFSKFKMVLMEALFADFGKFGSAVMSGDYMFSLNGRIGNTVYNNGETYNSVPAYTYFRGDPDGKFNVGKLNGSTSTSASSQYPNVLNTLSLSKGQTLTVVLNVTSQYGTATIGVRTVGSSSYLSSQSWSQGTTAKKTITVTASSVMEVEIVLSTSGQGTSVIGSGYYTFSNVFIPNWWVDLKTGKMSAAKGNFVVDANGDVHVKSGDVDIKGTVKATNLFRTLTLTSGNGAGNQGVFGGANNDTPCNIRSVTLNPDGSQATWIYFRQAATVNGVTFQQGKYYTSAEVEAANDINSYYALDWKNDPDKCSVCTGPADEVMLIDNYTAPLQVGGVVLLPRCEDFAGKTVVVRHTTSNGNNSVNIYQCDYASNKFYGTGQMNGWAYYEASQSEAYFSIEKGQTVTFYSTGTKWLVVAKS